MAFYHHSHILPLFEGNNVVYRLLERRLKINHKSKQKAWKIIIDFNCPKHQDILGLESYFFGAESNDMDFMKNVTTTKHSETLSNITKTFLIISKVSRGERNIRHDFQGFLWVRMWRRRLCLCLDFLWHIGHSNFGSTPHSNLLCLLSECGRV